MNRASTFALLAFVLVLLPTRAPAQSADTVAEKARASLAEAAPGTDRPLQFTAELGTALTKGNTETLHLHLDARLIWTPAERLLLTSRAKALYEESLSTVTANSYAIAERVDRFVSEKIALFAGAALERDIFAGIGRRISGQLGVALLALELVDPSRELTTDTVRLELGGYAAREDRTVPPRAPPGTVLTEPVSSIYAARGAVAAVHAFEKGSELGLELELIQDFVDTNNLVANSTVFVTAAMVENLSIKLAANHRFDNVPADPALKKSDFLLTGALVASF